MGDSTLSAADMADWVASSGETPRLIGVTVRELAQMFLDEGAAEGVRGDIAFAQAVFETGRFQFSARFPAELHNFAGIGGTRPIAFSNARMGVRGQIQLLRVYADPEIARTGPAHPFVDSRIPKAPPAGQVPTFDALSGRWAPGADYGAKVLAVYGRMLTFAGGNPEATASLPTPDLTPSRGPKMDAALNWMFAVVVGWTDGA